MADDPTTWERHKAWAERMAETVDEARSEITGPIPCVPPQEFPTGTWEARPVWPDQSETVGSDSGTVTDKAFRKAHGWPIHSRAASVAGWSIAATVVIVAGLTVAVLVLFLVACLQALLDVIVH